MTTNAVLSVSNLTTQLGDKEKPVRAVDGISFDLKKGKTFVLLGESGCGKSMIAMSLMRLLPASGRIVAGDVTLNGRSLLSLSEVDMRRERGGKISMIFQEPMTSLNPVMRVGEQVAESIKLHDLDCADIRHRVLELFISVGIPAPEQRIDEYPHQLSGGMKQRIMIAMALAGRPDVLIADEPTTALDVTIQSQVLELLKELQRDTGMAILLITHDLGVAAEMADDIGVMYAGKMLETASVSDFFKHAQHPYSQKLFKSLPSANKRNSRLEIISGMVPPLNQVFTQCRFLQRCEKKVEACEQTMPQWQGDVTSGYRCHLPANNTLSNTNTAIDSDPIESIHPSDDEQLILKVSDLKMHFPIKRGVFRRTVGHVKAVDGVSLRLKQGRTLALVGESGCGKTTVGKAILQLLEVTSGSVVFKDQELTTTKGKALRKLRQDFQIIFQDPASSMNPRMLVEDILTEGMKAQGIAKSAAERREKALTMLANVGLPEDALLRYPHEFSGGQRQRIAIARALAVNPQLIICDEPTSALDVSVQAQVLNLLKKLQSDLNLSYLFITHNIAVVAYLADEVAVMYLGRIVEQGTVEKILQTPKHPYTQALLNAVPVADPESKRTIIKLEGDIPSPSNPPSGCHFHQRCPKAMDRCKEAYPPSKSIEGQEVACWLYE